MIMESLITCILQLNICHIFIHKIKAHFTNLFHLYIRNKLHRLLGEKQAVIAVKTGRISPNCGKYSPALWRKPNGNPGIGQIIVRVICNWRKHDPAIFYSWQKSTRKIHILTKMRLT